VTAHLRDRATVVVVRDGLVLLARDAGQAHFNMPGGGIEKGESPEEAAVRELREETGMAATRTESLFMWDSTAARHHVFRADAEGDTRTGAEIAELLWGDGKGPLATAPHVKVILERLRSHD
jgi:8-oxo-dGTP pyrophosphatase MutT (NUDIX family)